VEETVETKKCARIESIGPRKPGESGDPGSKLKRDVASEIARAVFEGNEEAIYRALRRALLKGNPRVFVALAERAYGKLKEPVELSVTAGLAERLAAIRKRKLEGEMRQKTFREEAGRRS
jgi:hypothetical protein